MTILKKIKKFATPSPFFKTKEKTQQWLDTMGVTNYTINLDLTVDVNDTVSLYCKKLKKIPVQFGRVTGHFYCSGNKLKSLQGCPTYIGKDFSCLANNLKSLKYGPKEVVGSYDCSFNKLKELDAARVKIGGIFYAHQNRLPSLAGAPQSVGKSFYCQENELKTLEGAPSNILGNFHCHDNHLTTLKHIPQNISGDLHCNQNPINDFNNLEFTVEQKILFTPLEKKDYVLSPFMEALEKYRQNTINISIDFSELKGILMRKETVI